MKSTAAPPAPRTPVAPAEVPITEESPAKPPSRRWGLVALCVAAAAVCGLGAVAAVNSAGDRTSVLAIARDVPAGQKIRAQDVTTASISSDGALSSMPAADRRQVVGRRAATDLRSGGLLSPSQLKTGDALGDGKQLVGVQVKRGQAPAGSLSRGDDVLAVATAGQGEEPAASEKESDSSSSSDVAGVVISVGRPDASGTVVVNVAVSPADGPTLASRAASGRVALVREPRS